MEAWLQDGLDFSECLAVVALLTARQIARGEPMQSLAYADHRLRGEGLRQVLEPEELLEFGAVCFQVGFPGVEPTLELDAAEAYPRSLYEQDPTFGSWAFHGLTEGTNQMLRQTGAPPEPKTQRT